MCSSCLKARAGDRNGVGREGIAIKSNTEALKCKTKCLPDKWTSMLQGTIEGEKVKELGVNTAFLRVV